MVNENQERFKMYRHKQVGLLLISTLFTFANQSDYQNFNRALSEKNTKYCTLIQERDQKASCFGIIKRNTGYCKMIKNADLQNKCLAVALDDQSYCNKIQNLDQQKECKIFSRDMQSHAP